MLQTLSNAHSTIG